MPAAAATAAAASGPGAASGKGPGPKTGTAEGGRLVQEEQSATGGVSFAVVKAYVRALGGWPVVFLLFTVFILAELFRVGSTVWLSIWTGEGCAGIVCSAAAAAGVWQGMFVERRRCAHGTRSRRVELQH